MGPQLDENTLAAVCCEATRLYVTKEAEKPNDRQPVNKNLHNTPVLLKRSVGNTLILTHSFSQSGKAVLVSS